MNIKEGMLYALELALLSWLWILGTVLVPAGIKVLVVLTEQGHSVVSTTLIGIEESVVNVDVKEESDIERAQAVVFLLQHLLGSNVLKCNTNLSKDPSGLAAAGCHLEKLSMDGKLR